MNLPRTMRPLVAACLAALVLQAAEPDRRLAIVHAARAQIGKTVSYDPAYRKLSYPNGDLPLETGVCTDVVIRALRTALQFDLQKEVHEDMQADFSSYPQRWGLKKPDRNIDHRRVPNLQAFLERKGYALKVQPGTSHYQPGDLVTCLVPPSLPHIMIISDRRDRSGRPWVIHNIGSGTREEDRLSEFKITGHYRLVR
jgi:uncharacterized protein